MESEQSISLNRIWRKDPHAISDLKRWILMKPSLAYNKKRPFSSFTKDHHPLQWTLTPSVSHLSFLHLRFQVTGSLQGLVDNCALQLKTSDEKKERDKNEDFTLTSFSCTCSKHVWGAKMISWKRWMHSRLTSSPSVRLVISLGSSSSPCFNQNEN